MDFDRRQDSLTRQDRRNERQAIKLARRAGRLAERGLEGRYKPTKLGGFNILELIGLSRNLDNSVYTRANQILVEQGNGLSISYHEDFDGIEHTQRMAVHVHESTVGEKLN